MQGRQSFLHQKKSSCISRLEANEELDQWEQRFKRITATNVSQARNELLGCWRRISRGEHVGVGNWGKILKRVYAAATRVDSDLLEGRAQQDLVDHPDQLDERIFGHFAKRNRGELLLNLFSQYCEAGENLFEATETAFFESLLLLDPTPVLAASVRRFASLFAQGGLAGQSGKPMGRASAILCCTGWVSPPQIC